MKPIKLEIEGINSYSSKQVIDFEKLTSKGLFGIFGKTGSGKSTILDAITLSLYGNIARGTKEFINSNSDKATVDYEFELVEESKRQRYRVSRRFKKKVSDTKTSSISDYVRLMKLNDAGEFDVLAERVGDVNTQIKNIVGLEESDFLKSVVLPQGKFSEFLTLTGKERREMLERIFNLEEYGTQLNIRLSAQKRVCLDGVNMMEARLSEYPNISTEIRDSIEKELKQIEKEKINFEKDYKKEINNFDEQKRLYSLTEEKKEYLKKEAELSDKASDFAELELLVATSKKAANLVPIVKETNSLKSSIEEKKVDKVELERNIEASSKEVQKIDKEFIEVDAERENIPVLLNYKNDFERLYEDKKDLEDKVKETLNISNTIKAIEENLEKVEKRQKTIEEQLNRGAVALEEVDKEIKDCIVDKDYREAVIFCKNIEVEIKNFTKTIKNQENIIKSEQNFVKSNEKKVNLLKEENCKLEVELKRKIQCLENTEKVKVLSEEEFDKLNNDIIEIEKIISKIDESNNNIEKLEKVISENISKKELIKNKTLEIEKKLEYTINEIEKLLLEGEKFKIENLVVSLKRSLKEHFKSGDSCPVCGNHMGEILIDDIDIKEAEDLEFKIEILTKEKEILLKEQSDQKSSFNVLTALLEKSIEEKEIISKNISEYNFEKLKVRKSEMIKYREEQKDIKVKNAEEIKKLKEAIGKLELEMAKVDKEIFGYKSAINTKNENIENAEKYFFDILADLKNDEELLKSKMNEYSITNLSEAYRDIVSKDEIYADKVKQKKKIEEYIEKINKEKIENVSLENKYLRDISVYKTKNDEINKSIIGIKKHSSTILSKINQDYIEKRIGLMSFTIKKEIADLPTLELIDTAKMIKEYCDKISEQYKSVDLKLKDTKDMLAKIKSDYEKNIAESNLLKSNLKNKVEELSKNMKEHNFDSEEDIIKAYLDEKTLNEYMNNIEKFKKETQEIKIKLGDVEKKLGGKSIDIESIKVQEKLCLDIEAKLENAKRIYAETKYKLEDVEKKLKTVGELLAKLDIAKKELNNCLQLEKVLRGGRFVEYLSQIYLKNIVVEASERLDKITNGRYSLEIDTGYMFVICDNANGGIRRSADTLSGGETFLTSLSLALALSSQIQLKGSAPLEFFFLDEGFGTLDSDLLETVMDSLEKLHSPTLSVGIISHVEELKSRIPMKLIVEMDELNTTSLAKIELS